MTAEVLPIAPPPTGWTVADLEQLPDSGVRYELVDGVPRVMASPKLRHQHAQRRVANALEAVTPPGYLVAEAVGIEPAPDQRPIPDVVILRGVEPDDDRDNFPATLASLVVEVVSPSSRADDRFRKPAQYAQAGIPVYLRVELDPPHVVAYEIGEDGLYIETTRAQAGGILNLDRPFPIEIEPAALLR